MRLNYADGNKRYYYTRDGLAGLSGLTTRDLPLYRADCLLTLKPDEAVILTEGEKASDALVGRGFYSVGTACGANVTPSEQILVALQGRRVFLWPDNDEPGREHMRRIGNALLALSIECFMLEWLDAPPKGDAADFVEAGLNVETLFTSACRIVPTSTLPFRTAPEFLRGVSTEPDYVVRPYLAEGTVVFFHADAKAGKTTLVHVGWMRSVLCGEPFLGEPVGVGPVVYLSEEGPQTLSLPLGLAGISNHPNLHILGWGDAPDRPWAEVVAETLQFARAIHARLVVVDTLANWAGLDEDGEQSSGAMMRELKPLLAGRAPGMVILVLHHSRKAGGTVVGSMRGSGAIAAAADVVLQLIDGQGMRPTARALLAKGRLPDLPPRLVIELQGDRYVALRGGESAGGLSVRVLFDALPIAPAEAVRVEDLEASLGARRTSLRGQLKALVASGRAATVGSGKKGDATRYYRIESDSAAPKGTTAAAETATREPGE